MRFARILTATTGLWLMTASVGWAGDMLVEMTVDGVVHTGTPIVSNKSISWLASRDGTYTGIDLLKVTAFKKLTSEFRPETPEQLATQLRRQLGSQFEVLVRNHYVVCAPPGRAFPYAELLSRTSDAFYTYFNKRSIRVERPKFPLVVMIWSTRAEFDDSCRRDGMEPSPLVRGYYHPESNRVTLYDNHDHDPPIPGEPRPAGNGRRPGVGVLGETSRNTAMHEAIHQLAFNSGLHSRIGQNPRWVVEGLATMLETGILQSEASGGTGSKINLERLKAYFEYRKTHQNKMIADFVASDEEAFQQSPVEAYGISWALTFYLVEIRRNDYFRYLQKIANRDPLEPIYSAKDRLADFQAVFGMDIQLLEHQMVRYLDGHN